MKMQNVINLGLSAAVLFSFLNIWMPSASADVVIDDFSSTAGNGTIFLNAPPTVPNVQNGGLGSSVVGGGTTQRTTTLSSTGGILTGSINPASGQLFGNSTGGGASGTLSTQYNSNMNAGGLSANLAGFLGVSVDVLAFSPGTDVSSTVTVTLTDGSGNPAAVGMGVITAAGELIIPSGAFTNLGTLDLSDIDDILVVFGIGEGQELRIGSIVALTPEPLTLLLWACGCLGFAFFWRRYGSRIRKPSMIA